MQKYMFSNPLQCISNNVIQFYKIYLRGQYQYVSIIYIFAEICEIQTLFSTNTHIRSSFWRNICAISLYIMLLSDQLPLRGYV